MSSASQGSYKILFSNILILSWESQASRKTLPGHFVVICSYLIPALYVSMAGGRGTNAIVVPTLAAMYCCLGVL